MQSPNVCIANNIFWMDIGGKKMATGKKCDCGFQFSGAGEFRNCNCFLKDGKWINICPKCKGTNFGWCYAMFAVCSDCDARFEYKNSKFVEWKE